MYQKNVTLPQLQENKNFPKAISDYIIKTDPKDVSGDAFVLLSEIYMSSSFKEVKKLVFKYKVTSVEFIKGIFDSIENIKEEEVFNSIVLILSNINDEAESENNPFTSVFKDHENSRLVLEVLLKILNSTENKLTIYKILKCLRYSMILKDECILYSSDLEAFISLTIKKLETTSTSELRSELLKVLKQIINYEDYYKNKYRFDSLVELLECYESQLDPEDENRKLAIEVLEILKKHS